MATEGRLNTNDRAVASRTKTGRGVVTASIFLLVPQVKLPKRLDMTRENEQADGALPRVRTHSQNMTTAARAQAERKRSAHRS